ncbi:MAG: hypothetical protein ABIJ81_03160 [Patescibacteria group bacterium]
MPKYNVQHKFSLRGVFKPQGWKLQARKFFSVQKVNDTPAVHRIARQSVRVPSQNSVCLALLYFVQHFVKNRTARNFGRLFFNKYINNIQVFLLGKGTQFRDLVFNRTYLFIFHIGGLAGV